MCYVKAGAVKIIVIISSMHMCMILTHGISTQVSNGGIISDQSARERSVINEIGLTRAHLLFTTHVCHHNGHTRRCAYVIYCRLIDKTYRGELLPVKFIYFFISYSHC